MNKGRRQWIGGILSALGLRAASGQVFIQPMCRVCGTRFEKDAPVYSLVVSNVPGGDIVSLPNTRLLVCQECGVCKVVAVPCRCGLTADQAAMEPCGVNGDQ